MDEDEQAAGAGEAATKLAGEAAAEHVADAGVAAKLPRRCSREDVPAKMFPRSCSRTGFPTMFRQEGCDGAATGLRRCRTNASGCPSDDAPATAPERTTGTHRSPRNAPLKPARCVQPARPSAGRGGVRSAAGVPSDVPPTMLDVPDDGPGDGFGDRQCSRTPAGAGCQAIRMPLAARPPSSTRLSQVQSGASMAPAGEAGHADGTWPRFSARLP